MSSRVLPSPEEVPALVPAPGSVVWRFAGDARLLTCAGYALLLQVSHPTVGAGVGEHSDFKADPYGRLLRTLDYSYALVYGGPKLSAEIGARVRHMHKRIKGTKPNGERYSALEPEAYAWVHATLCEAIVTGHRRFGLRMRPDEIERFYAGWHKAGRLVGVRERDLPDDWAAFCTYFDHKVEHRLEDNAAVQDVIATLTHPARPPVPILNEAAWRVLRLPMVRLFALATVGLLPPALRERFGARWTRAQELELRALGTAARAATPLLPRSLRNTGPPYLRWRRDAIARGDVASPATGPRSLPRAA